MFTSGIRYINVYFAILFYFIYLLLFFFKNLGQFFYAKNFKL